ncbi:MAG: cystathionine gamma-synthase [Alphaproteobacteria bacterium]|nr:cystathionine gamma-synthase [Alphaproteobacteria bacterium]
MSKTRKPFAETTIAARAAIDQDPAFRAVTPPLYMSTNYAFDGYDSKGAYEYSRCGNPTRDALGHMLATLEGGAHGVITASGMAGIMLACQILKPGDLIIASHDCYGGTFRLLSTLAERGQFRVTFADLTDPGQHDSIFAEKCAMVFIETPSNPLLRITDIEAVAAQAKKHGALTVVDNTFLSPVLQKPLALGADIVLHSTTKYINGHGDVVGGAVISRTQEMHDNLAWWANCIGVTGGAFDSFLTMRGARTLTPRVLQQSHTAGILADFLSGHTAVENVYYPGLSTHPGHKLAAQQQKGFGGMLSFTLKGGTTALRQFIAAATGGSDAIFTLAESLGGYESLVTHPATMTHAAMTPDARANAGISDSLLRLSIGLEDADDLTTALDTALSAAQRAVA